jgi:hypothetical protein
MWSYYAKLSLFMRLLVTSLSDAFLLTRTLEYIYIYIYIYLCDTKKVVIKCFPELNLNLGLKSPKYPSFISLYLYSYGKLNCFR